MAAAGDFALPRAYREQARVWSESEFKEYIDKITQQVAIHPLGDPFEWPFHTKAEPHRKVHIPTDRPGAEPDRRARLMRLATLRSVDQYVHKLRSNLCIDPVKSCSCYRGEEVAMSGEPCRPPSVRGPWRTWKTGSHAGRRSARRRLSLRSSKTRRPLLRPVEATTWHPRRSRAGSKMPRRAWFGVPRRSIYDKPVKSPPKIDPAFEGPLKAMIEAEPSFGYRTVAWLLGFNKNTEQRVFQLKGWHLSRSGKASTAATAFEHALIARFGTLGRVEAMVYVRNSLSRTAHSRTVLWNA